MRRFDDHGKCGLVVGRHHSFSDLMRESGLSQADIARRVGVHPNTVSAWSLGRHRVPVAVLAYLDLLIQVRRAGL